MSVEIFYFGPGESHDLSKKVLGGKGYALMTLCSLGMPVPPGLVIPTNYCIPAITDSTFLIDHLVDAAIDRMHQIREKCGYPCLFSVRSGARESMPGMMDTILNIGIDEESFLYYLHKYDQRFIADCYRRFLQMYGSVVCHIPEHEFEGVLEFAREQDGVGSDAEIDGEGIEQISRAFEAIYCLYDAKIPTSLYEQVRGAITAVFKSWYTSRAIAYREENGLPHHWGTAVVIQQMVFGNLNQASCSGVLFTRCPSTGKNEVVGDWLSNAQGEEVVSGVRTPTPLQEMKDWNVEVYDELLLLGDELEDHFQDMQDIEFTVEDGQLYLLQTRSGKRTPAAAVEIAKAFGGEVVASASYKQLLRSGVAKVICSDVPLAIGIPAGGGAVTGIATYNKKNVGPESILIAKETTPDDYAAMVVCKGILTKTGGTTCHAAVVARELETSCIVGCSHVNVIAQKIAGQSVPEGTKITIDPSTGGVWLGAVSISSGTPEAPDMGTAMFLALSPSEYGYGNALVPLSEVYSVQGVNLSALEWLKGKGVQGFYAEPWDLEGLEVASIDSMDIFQLPVFTKVSGIVTMGGLLVEAPILTVPEIYGGAV